jgi:hypothetical protein
MKRTAISLAMAATFALAGSAFAQNQPQNVSESASLCANGYDAAASSGRLSGPGMSQYGRETVDANHDGVISKMEFDNACATNLFQRTEKSTSGG